MSWMLFFFLLPLTPFILWTFVYSDRFLNGMLFFLPDMQCDYAEESLETYFMDTEHARHFKCMKIDSPSAYHILKTFIPLYDRLGVFDYNIYNNSFFGYHNTQCSIAGSANLCFVSSDSSTVLSHHSNFTLYKHEKSVYWRRLSRFNGNRVVSK